MNFQKCLEARADLVRRQYEKQKAFDDRLKLQIKAIWKKNSKKKLDYSQLADIVEYQQLMGKFKERGVAEKFWSVWRRRIEAADVELRRLAEETEVAPGGPSIFDRISSHNWSTQGYGAITYARNAAQKELDRINSHGVSGRLELVDTGSCGGCSYGTYLVWADTDEIGVQILKYKKLPPLAETIRLYWKRGANPRVDYPFLPHGYEESIGIDYFGNIVNQGLYNNTNRRIMNGNGAIVGVSDK